MISVAVISDLHVRANAKEQEYTIDKIVQHFEELRSRGKKIDLLLFTGDLTYHGKKSEFGIVENFLKRLESSLDLPKDRIHITAGNHDYNRDDTGTAFRYFDNPDSKKYLDIFESDDFKQHINTSFGNYNLFIKNYIKQTRNIEGYAQVITIEDKKIKIAAINSALSNTLGRKTLPAFINIKGLDDLIFTDKENYDLALLIIHHPLEDFYIENRRRLKRKLRSCFDIVFTGHDHSPNYQKIGGSDGKEFTYITNGCAFLSDNRNPENYQYRFFVLDYNPNMGEINISYYFTRRGMEYCGIDASVSPEVSDSGILRNIIEYRWERSTKINEKNPLKGVKISSELSDYFKYNYRKFYRLESKQELFNIRREMNLSTGIKLDDLALVYLKYLLDNEVMRNQNELKEALNKYYIFSLIRYYHPTILHYYNKGYFESKSRNLDVKLGLRGKRIRERELRKKIQQQQEELDSLRKEKYSVVENYRGKPEHLLPPLKVVEDTRRIDSQEWYKNVNLKADPFPSLEGFDKIDDRYYDTIIYHTHSIKFFQNKVLDNIESLKQTSICVDGDFGSGKTTLFQYMRNLIKTHHKDIITLDISLDVRESLEVMKNNFFFHLYICLKRIHLEINQFVPTETNKEYACVEMLESLSVDKKAVIIFIEDIYKHSSLGDFIEEVIGFIQSLQIFKKNLSVYIPTSFIFSALPDIGRRIEDDHSTSGSVDMVHSISFITIDEALRMINKRLRVFSETPNNPYIISREYLNRICTLEKHSGKSVKTFRDYIKVLLKHFRRKEFDETAIKIKAGDKEIVEIVVDLENSHPELEGAFMSLKKMSKEGKNTFIRFIDLLEYFWLNEPIVENDHLYFEYRSEIVRLSNLNLITKIIFEGKTAWTISRNCEQYFNKIKGKYSINPVNILPEVLFSKDTTTIHENEVTLRFKSIMSRSERYGPVFLKKLKNSLELYQELYKFSRSPKMSSRKRIIENTEIKKIQEAISDLVIAFVIQCDKDVDDYDSALRAYENSWYEIEEVTLFIHKLHKSIENPTEKVENKLALLGDYLVTVNLLTSKLKRFVQWDNWFSLKDLVIWKSDKKALNNIRRNLESSTFSHVRTRIEKLIKTRLKRLLYLYTNILFGKNKWKRGLPQRVNLELKNLSSMRYKRKDFIDYNLLNYLPLVSLIRSLNYLNKIKFDSKISFLTDLSSTIESIVTVVSQKTKDAVPWTNEVLRFIELTNEFYISLLNNSIPCPWNTQFVEYKSSLSNLSLDEIFNTSNKLIFDHHLILKNSLTKRITEPELVHLLAENLETISVEFDYKKEEIRVTRNLSTK